MAIAFGCPQCGHKLRAGDAQAGQRARCTRCGTTVVVPAPLKTAPPQSSSPLLNAPPSRSPQPLSPQSMDEGEAEAPIRFPRPHHESNADVDLTPMIDVVFQLLIFFMVTAAFGLQKSLDLPSSSASQESQAAQTIEELEQDEDYVVARVERDNTIWINDSEATSEPDLFAKLRDAKQPRDGRAGARQLLVIAHGGARHERVVQVLDAGSTAGMESVKLTSVDDP